MCASGLGILSLQAVAGTKVLKKIYLERKVNLREFYPLADFIFCVVKWLPFLSDCGGPPEAIEWNAGETG